MPQSVGIFTALLKREGYTLDLFDCTYYLDADIEEQGIGKNTNAEKVINRNVRKFDNKVWQGKGIAPKTGIEKDFKKKISTFQPDLILVSVLESTYFLAINLLNSIPEKDRKFKTLWWSFCNLCIR